MDTFVISSLGVSPQNATAIANSELRDWLDLEEGTIQHVAMSVLHVPQNDPDSRYVCNILIIFQLKPVRKG